MERLIRVFRTPEEAEAESRAAYARMSPDERVALTVELMRRYYAAMTLPDDFREFLRLLVEHEVEFMVIGGHAVSHHGYPRFTHDVDVVVEPSRENAERLIAALDDFGFGALDLTAAEFTRDTTVVLGRAPHEIDIMTFVKGVELKSAWDRRSYGSLDGVSVPFIGKDDLIANKRAVGRPEDLADVARLTRVP